MAFRTFENCPFVPGSDRVPEVWAGRADELADWRDKVRARRRLGTYERGRALLGPAGIGKSVLVNRIAADAAHAGDLVAPAVRLPRGADALALLAEALTDLADEQALAAALARRAAGILDRVRRLGHPALGEVELAEPARVNPHRDVTRLLVEVGRLAAEDDVVVLLRVDEVQNVSDADQLSQLLVAVGDALAYEQTVTDAAGVRHSQVLPLAVYLTGLPEFLHATRRAGATFARRFQPVHLAPLTATEIRQALAPFRRDGFEVVGPDGPTRVFMEDGAIATVEAACLGDPHLFQLAGEAAWNAGDGQVVSAAEARRGWNGRLREARSHVERLLERLPERERAALDALVALPSDERTATAVARALGRSDASAVGSALQRLDDDRGIIARGRPITFRMRTVEAFLADRWPQL